MSFGSCQTLFCRTADALLSSSIESQEVGWNLKKQSKLSKKSVVSCQLKDLNLRSSDDAPNLKFVPTSCYSIPLCRVLNFWIMFVLN